MNTNIEAKLRSQIYGALLRVTSANSPEVYNRIQTESGYKSMEQKIIDRVINGNIVVSAAIPQIEIELSE